MPSIIISIHWHVRLLLTPVLSGPIITGRQLSELSAHVSCAVPSQPTVRSVLSMVLSESHSRWLRGGKEYYIIHLVALDLLFDLYRSDKSQIIESN
jgi:hypothetical protein